MARLIAGAGFLLTMAVGGFMLWWATLPAKRRTELPKMHPVVKQGLLCLFALLIAAAFVVTGVSLQNFADLSK